MLTDWVSKGRDRAQSMGVVYMLLSIGTVIMVYWFSDPINTKIISKTRDTTDNTVALEGVLYLEQLHANFLFIMVGIAVLGLVAFSVFRRQFTR